MNKEEKESNSEKLIHIDLPLPPEEKKYIVCYIDILGSQNMITQKGSKKFFEKIYDSFSFATNIETKLKIFGDLKFKVFSDNILIACEVENENEKSCIFRAYNNVINFIKHMAVNFLYEGILFRGGITIDLLAINDIMVWGSGLAEAVKIEEDISVYPRIVVSNKLVNIFKLYELEEYQFEEKFSCFHDFDGCIFVDYIQYNEMPTAEMTIRESYRIINEKINTETSEKILQKYIWHKNYLQKAKDIYNEYYGDIEYLELDF